MKKHLLSIHSSFLLSRLGNWGWQVMGRKKKPNVYIQTHCHGISDQVYLYYMLIFSVENIQKSRRKCQRIKTTHNPIIQRKLLIFGVIFFCSCCISPKEYPCETVLPTSTSEKPSLIDVYFFMRDTNLRYNIVPAVIFIITLLGTLSIKK